MALFKCKMCGGSLEIQDGTSIIECEFCGTQQTLPKLEDEKRANLYDRANHFRRNNEFDKAIGIYEKILNEDPTDAEAYWSLVLCRYGIEYVEDPATHKRVPTVNRAQFTSVFDDEDYKSALQNADIYQRAIYEAEANAINEIQKGILAISQKEEPFDVFICYKESDNNGSRTPDSVLAQELYFQLKQEGFKVFFSRITLEDKLGVAYEPYIFAALNSAKVMVVLGTKPEYFNAVWVKNEWSRYLALIKQGKPKTLIPAYKDMDPYDLPEEFSHLQAQDVSKLGFMQDLIRGIGKIAHTEKPTPTVIKETVVSATATNTAPLLKRAFMFLEDGDWNSANEYCEKVLDIDPECADAYLGKLMAICHSRKKKDIVNWNYYLDGYNDYNKIMRFGSEELKAEIASYADKVKAKLDEERYLNYINEMQNASTEQEFIKIAEKFASLEGYKDSEKLRKECIEEKAKEARRIWDCYDLAIKYKDQGTANKDDTAISNYEKALELLESIRDFIDVDAHIEFCIDHIKEIKKAQELKDIEKKKLEAELKECEKSYFEKKAQYDSIPSENQIKKMVCKRKGIIALTIFGILFLIALWPIGAIIIWVRHNKVQKAVAEEKDKCQKIESSYHWAKKHYNDKRMAYEKYDR